MISRTMARPLVERLQENSLLADSLGGAARSVRPSDYYDRSETLETKDILRRAFMHWIIEQELAPGMYIDERKVAARLRIPLLSVREFLISMSQFGYFRKVRDREWVVEDLDRTFFSQMLDVRMMFELNSIAPLIELPEQDPFWRTLYSLRNQHLDLLETKGGETLPFVELDNAFHGLLNTASNNRVMQIFQDAVFFVFYFHYRWDNSDERARNEIAMREHLNIMDAIFDKDVESSRSSLRGHLQAAQDNLLSSIENRIKR
ncbi:GntR family transcriptional regulator [Salipiger mangrovisoli]|uniref:GntR family transcriptional regulator n=1 Tax=Salipiger mangrovisoli TaxID=2865933 RepID=A0ABR9XA30_9RHOB|nr:GntR family transcriptional regulator [Salipiger mangrovisoli]MBE9640470.1 GntR family transcriptional regulator [Salipiger mangrovisoli]